LTAVRTEAIADVLDRLATDVPGTDEKEWPAVVPLPEIVRAADGGLLSWITDRKNRRAIPHRMEQCGYVPVRNERNEGRWIIKGTRQVVHARSDLSIRDRFLAAQAPRELGNLSTFGSRHLRHSRRGPENFGN
jgi:hypothetical protein